MYVKLPVGFKRLEWLVCQVYAPAVFTPQEIPVVIISLRVWIDNRDTTWPETLSQWKTTVKPSGIEPETFRLAAQCLNQMRHSFASVRVFHIWKANSPSATKCSTLHWQGIKGLNRSDRTATVLWLDHESNLSHKLTYSTNPKNLAPTGVKAPKRPPHSESLCQLRYLSRPPCLS